MDRRPILATQTLVALEGDKPLFATLVSTGKGPRDRHRDPQGGVSHLVKLARAQNMDNLEDGGARRNTTPSKMSPSCSTSPKGWGSTALFGTEASAMFAATAASTWPRATRNGSSRSPARTYRPTGPRPSPRQWKRGTLVPRTVAGRETSMYCDFMPVRSEGEDYPPARLKGAKLSPITRPHGPSPKRAESSASGRGSDWASKR